MNPTEKILARMFEHNPTIASTSVNIITALLEEIEALRETLEKTYCADCTVYVPHIPHSGICFKCAALEANAKRMEGLAE